MQSRSAFCCAVRSGVETVFAVLPGGRLTPQDRQFLLGHIMTILEELSREFDGKPPTVKQSRIGPWQRCAISAADPMDFVSPDMLIDDYRKRIETVAALWKDEMARRWPRRKQFAMTMREQLYEQDNDRWRAYAAWMRRTLPWFGREAGKRLHAGG
ncbi:hypothetical protein AAGS40_29875 (plasmid) [Paraburkholderia sp. PREW-6R]|uniref:hypothetical protein n=1 Tax=Paraburkholderia sp. PREW-6R TaxID=3141544 RepID=UPI0031F49BA9